MFGANLTLFFLMAKKNREKMQKNVIFLTVRIVRIIKTWIFVMKSNQNYYLCHKLLHLARWRRNG